MVKSERRVFPYPVAPRPGRASAKNCTVSLPFLYRFSFERSQPGLATSRRQLGPPKPVRFQSISTPIFTGKPVFCFRQTSASAKNCTVSAPFLHRKSFCVRCSFALACSPLKASFKTIPFLYHFYTISLLPAAHWPSPSRSTARRAWPEPKTIACARPY